MTFSRFSAAILALALLAAAVATAGCHQPQRTEKSEAELSAERHREALRLIGEAAEAEERGDLDAAAALYSQAVAAAPDLPIAWNNLGVVLMNQRKYLDAGEAFKKAADLSPTDPRPYQNLGLVYHRAGFDEEARRYYELSLERDPNWVASLRGIAVCSRRLGAADQKLSDMLHHALMVETDPDWHDVIQRERLRVDGQLREATRR